MITHGRESHTSKPMRVFLHPEAAAAAAVVQRAGLQRKGEESALYLLNSMFHALEGQLPECVEPFHAALKKKIINKC